MKRRLLIALAGLCAFATACGTSPTTMPGVCEAPSASSAADSSPPSAPSQMCEATEASALVSSQIWQSGSSSYGVFSGSSWSCAGQTWYPRMAIRQYVDYSWGETWATLYLDGAGANNSRNEVTFICSGSGGDGNATSHLYSYSATTCSAYAHVAGQGYTFSASVTINAGDTWYYPKGFAGFTNGLWNSLIQLPSTTTDLTKWGTGYGLACLAGPSPTGVFFYFD